MTPPGQQGGTPGRHPGARCSAPVRGCSEGALRSRFIIAQSGGVALLAQVRPSAAPRTLVLAAASIRRLLTAAWVRVPRELSAPLGRGFCRGPAVRLSAGGLCWPLGSSGSVPAFVMQDMPSCCASCYSSRCRVTCYQRTACTRSWSKRQWAGSSYRIRIQQSGYSCKTGDGPWRRSVTKDNRVKAHTRRVGRRRGTVAGPFPSAPPHTGRPPFSVSGVPVSDCRLRGWLADSCGVRHLADLPARMPQTPAALPHVDGFPVRGVRRRRRRPAPKRRGGRSRIPSVLDVSSAT